MNTVNKVRIYTAAATLFVGGLYLPFEAVAGEMYPVSSQQENILEPETKIWCLTGVANITNDQVIKYSKDPVRASFEREGLLEPRVADPCSTGAAVTTSDQVIKYSENPVRASFERAGLLDPER